MAVLPQPLGPHRTMRCRTCLEVEGLRSGAMERNCSSNMFWVQEIKGSGQRDFENIGGKRSEVVVSIEVKSLSGATRTILL